MSVKGLGAQDNMIFANKTLTIYSVNAKRKNTDLNDIFATKSREARSILKVRLALTRAETELQLAQFEKIINNEVGRHKSYR